MSSHTIETSSTELSYIKYTINEGNSTACLAVAVYNYYAKLLYCTSG